MYKYLPHYISMLFVALFLSVSLYKTGALEKIEHITYDWRVQTLSSAHNASDDTVLIVVDQFSLEWMQEEQGIGWPWPREFYGAFTQFAKDAGAKAVVFDMIFSEDSVYNITDDKAFAESLKIIPTIGALALGSDNYGKNTWPQYLNQPQISNCSTDKSSEKIIFPIKELSQSFANFGFVNSLADSDGVIRRVDLCKNFDGMVVPSLALSTYNYLYTNREKSFDNEVIINYYNDQFSYKNYNAASVIQSWSALQTGEIPTLTLDLFKDKVIFIGVSAAGLFDQRVSPLSKNHPGVDIQATIYNNLVSDSFIKELSFKYSALYMLIFGLSTTFLMMLAKRVRDFIIPLIVIPLLVFTLGYIYYMYGYWFHVSIVLSVVVSVIVLSGILGYLLEGRQKRYLKTAFSQYVSPDIVNKLVQDPTQLKLGGESRKLSIFFSDIQGFTSISEKLEPEKLISMLHEYLDSLSTVILNHHGTIDKYEGDAIIAFWNAPLDTCEHERLSVEAALECQKTLDKLNPIFLKKYGVELRTRIGIHTGKVIVGNLGSVKHFDYSFIGDAGNLAARLEGVNKIFGTKILVSDVTKKKVTSVTFRKIGTIKVVGRNQALEVYEPFSETDKNEIYERFNKALTLFETSEFDAAKEIFESLSEVDEVARYYVQIIEEIENKSVVFDGAIVLSSK